MLIFEKAGINVSPAVPSLKVAQLHNLYKVLSLGLKVVSHSYVVAPNYGID
jgi:hypothetical protein